MGKKFEIGPIPDGLDTSCFSFKIDGNEIPVPSSFEFTSPFGDFMFGLRPEGFAGWAFKDIGGGGATVLPYAINENGDILVGLYPEDRPNLGGTRYCVVGGIRDPGESALQTAVREGKEEANIQGFNFELLPGIPVVTDRLYFVADGDKGEGVALYVFKVSLWHLRETDDGNYRFVTDLESNDGVNSKKLSGVVFMPWYKAVGFSPDALALSSIVRLLAMLRKK